MSYKKVPRCTAIRTGGQVCHLTEQDLVHAVPGTSAYASLTQNQRLLLEEFDCHAWAPPATGATTQPAADDRTTSAAASPTAANENPPVEGADASQAVRPIPSWLLAEAAKAIEMHAQAKGCPCDLAEDGVCDFYRGWWMSFLKHVPAISIAGLFVGVRNPQQQFYALVKEK